ncbi:MAG: cytochrome c oxidase subunit II [Candidatus Dormibacteria bacterium]
MNLLAIDMSPTNSAGPVAGRMQYVYAWVFWGSVVLGLVVTTLLLVSFFRFRRKSDDEEPAQVHGNTRLEITWTAIPFAILIMLFVVTALNMGYINDPNTSAKAITVKIQAQQFAWAVTYPGGQHSTNTLVVPVGTPVNIDLTSKDVNHSLYLPNLGGQMNALPGQTNHMWIQADNPDGGVYYGQCTELCGNNHHGMIIVVIALPEQQYASCIFGKGPIDADAVRRGQNVACKPPKGDFG